MVSNSRVLFLRSKIVFSIWVNSWVSGMLGMNYCAHLPTQSPLLPSPRPRLQCGAAFILCREPSVPRSPQSCSDIKAVGACVLAQTQRRGSCSHLVLPSAQGQQSRAVVTGGVLLQEGDSCQRTGKAQVKAWGRSISMLQASVQQWKMSAHLYSQKCQHWS